MCSFLVGAVVVLLLLVYGLGCVGVYMRACSCPLGVGRMGCRCLCIHREVSAMSAVSTPKPEDKTRIVLHYAPLRDSFGVALCGIGGPCRRLV